MLSRLAAMERVGSMSVKPGRKETQTTASPSREGAAKINGAAYRRWLDGLLVEDLTDYAIFLVDLEGRIVTWNAGAERILGYKEMEILGQPFSVLFMPE